MVALVIEWVPGRQGLGLGIRKAKTGVEGKDWGWAVVSKSILMVAWLILRRGVPF